MKTLFPDAQPNPDTPEVNDISVATLKTQVSSEEGAQIKLVDVREPVEYSGELGHIAGAELIPLGQLEERVAELPKDREIVFICRSGKRSVTASLIAQQNGLSTVFNMAGGMIRWNEEGFDVEE